MCVSSQMYTLGRKSSLSSENLSCSTTASTPRFNVAIYNFPLPPHPQRPWGSRSSGLPQLGHGKKVKIHHAFETVVEVPEELEQDMGFDSTIAGPDEEVPRVKQIVAEIIQYLSAEEINDAYNTPVDELPTNRPSSPERPDTPRPTKPPPRPPTPYPRPEPESDPIGNMTEPDEAMPRKPKPLPGSPGPPPPYPPPPIPQTLGESHRGAELYSNNGDIRLRMIRAARPAPPKALSKDHTLLKLSLEDQRWGGIIPRVAGAAKSKPHTAEGCGYETSFMYDPAGRKWCAISPMPQHNNSMAAISEACCEKQQPVSPGSSILCCSQDTIHRLNSVPEPGYSSGWEFSPKLDSENSEVHYIISTEKKPAVRNLFAHPKISFSKLRSVASMGSLKKAAISREEGGSYTGRDSSTSISSTSSYSTSSTTASQRKHKGMEGSFLTWPKFKGTTSRF
ncbi:hypothetical protein EV426DRAFT_574884 [Tirmania nivea]|nr:hypothetical protein EV426DRAFT_574884 [Tirmania nivea]